MPEPSAPIDLSELAQRARAAARYAYAPASGFAVGAAVRATDGRVFPGCNVENASYGLTVCAERNAVARAVCDGAREITALAVWTDTETPTPPCGACRQVLVEFASADCEVLLVGRDGALLRTSLGDLLPRPFTFEALGPQRPGVADPGVED